MRYASVILVLFLSLANSTLNADTVFITGANKGIGLEFTTQYLNKGWDVIATHRREKIPESLALLKSEYADKLRIETVDITAIDQVMAMGKRLVGVPIDILINNAGFGGEFQTDEQSLSTLDYDVFEVVMRTNGLGALAVTEALKENILAGKQKKIIAMTSTLASLTAGPPTGGGYWYRMSKAALHMSMITVAKDLKEHGVIVTLISPGLIFSQKNLRRGVPESIMINGAMSVSKMIKLTDNLTMENSGKFISYDGTELTL